jgi:acetoin utilization protein AcuB
MIIDQLMSTTLVSVSSDDSLALAREIFSHTHFHHLLIIEEGKLVGVLSDRDLFKAISPNIGTAAETPKDAATLRKHVHQIMSRKPITVSSGTSLQEAVHLFNTKPISCLPVVSEDNTPMGIITWRDILRLVEVLGLKEN